MIISGAIITIIGLTGLIYCILKALIAKNAGLKGEELSNELKKLLPINFILCRSRALAIVSPL